MAFRMHPFRSFLLALEVAALAACAVPAHASLVSGDVSGHWTVADSPVSVIAACFVSAGESLVIDPGVRIYLNPGVTFSIDGSLTAIGSSDNPISFSPTTFASGPWRSIRIGPTGQALLGSCVIQGGGQDWPDETAGTLYVDGGQLTLMHCDVTGSAGSGVFVRGGSLAAAGCHFDANGGGRPTDAGIHVVTGSVTLAGGADANSVTRSVYGVYNDDIIAVDARGTWWGASTGPQHVTNVLGQGVSVSDDVEFDGYLTVNPYPTRGDLDRDGLVTLHDAALLAQVAAGMASADAFTMQVGDIDADGSITLLDVSDVIRAAAGVSALP